METQSMVESILQSSVAAIFFVMARKKPKITQKFNELIGLTKIGLFVLVKAKAVESGAVSIVSV